MLQTSNNVNEFNKRLLEIIDKAGIDTSKIAFYNQLSLERVTNSKADDYTAFSLLSLIEQIAGGTKTDKMSDTNKPKKKKWGDKQE